ncbi:META domain-containing protein [Marinobacterium sp. YM272]|uniref:META domain-containing protein n=1 Tax=Marinobacterium sp. YM272 TaxID=3421654 RepID=UPI003D7F2530
MPAYSNQSFASIDNGAQLKGRWRVDSIGQRAVNSSTPLLIAFDESSRVGGVAGCNRFLGAYQIGAEGAFSIEDVRLTRRICPEPVMIQESLLINRLKHVSRTQLTSEGELLLFFDNDEQPIRLLPDSTALVNGAALSQTQQARARG